MFGRPRLARGWARAPFCPPCGRPCSHGYISYINFYVILKYLEFSRIDTNRALQQSKYKLVEMKIPCLNIQIKKEQIEMLQKWMITK